MTLLHYMATPIKYPWNWNTILFSKRPPHLTDPIQIRDTFVPWGTAVHYLGLVLDSKLLFTRHLHIVANKATDVFCNIPPSSPKIQCSHSPTSYPL